ncbi:hypothetical protein FOA52_000523 [Chlamydomonas sp. UWO 241]|nr:hypothetical protein FOA52_000523 [Chlamydomonas sp. UWO 241]
MGCTHADTRIDTRPHCRRPALPPVNYAAADPVYVLASEYLSQIGLLNLAERSRVLDIATNPSSLFLGRGRNASARPLSVDGDMRPVVEFLGARGVKSAELVQIIIGYPAVLGTAVPKLQAFWDYLESIGVTDVGSVIITRPNLLGLDVDANLRKIVDYLLYVETPVETIVKYIEKSI